MRDRMANILSFKFCAIVRPAEETEGIMRKLLAHRGALVGLGVAPAPRRRSCCAP